LSHHLDKISSNISKIATAIFFVNFFAYGRVFFATILATRISHGAVVALSFSMSVMTVITMVIFGILSIVGQDIAQAKGEASYQRHIAKYFKISLLISAVVLLLAFSFALLIYDHVGLLAAKFILVYAFGFIPFIFSTAFRYVLLAKSHDRIIKLTNVITFIVCVVMTLVCYYFFRHLSIVSFAFGCIIAFIYNLLHLTYFSLRKNIISFSFLKYVKTIAWVECLRFIYAGCQVSLVYASDSIVCAIIIMLTLSYGESYVVAVQVVLQLFLFASFWITGFANGVMIELPKYRSVGKSKKALRVILHYIFKKALVYWLIVAAILILFSGIILKYVFNLHGLPYEVAHAEVYVIVMLVLFDFIRQSFFYILRVLHQVKSAVFFSYLVFAVAIALMLVLQYFEVTPVAFLAIYIMSCVVISALYAKKIYNFKYVRR
jgi:Na+-driven multidrug efflux pump